MHISRMSRTHISCSRCAHILCSTYLVHISRAHISRTYLAHISGAYLVLQSSGCVGAVIRVCRSSHQGVSEQSSGTGCVGAVIWVCRAPRGTFLLRYRTVNMESQRIESCGASTISALTPNHRDHVLWVGKHSCEPLCVSGTPRYVFTAMPHCEYGE